ncbi:MAG: adenosylcobinamide-phosphate synthase CbiB [Pseudomonadota bacterium]
MSAAALMGFAWLIEIAMGWPDWLYKRIRHPVVWFGHVVILADGGFNRSRWSHHTRYVIGMISTLVLVSIATLIAWGIATLLPSTGWGVAIEALIASSLIASRSLYAHVAAVARPLANSDINTARQAVSMIVGRDPTRLDETGIARASIESLAENTADGVIAPLFWGTLAGLPGLVAYKAINTLDSMIGHRNDRYSAFGGFAARLDDVANLIPARLTGGLIALASLRLTAFKIMFRDASQHRSPNAGWPEAAMAGGLDVRLSGPRLYGDQLATEPWLNRDGRDPFARDVTAGLKLYQRAMMLAFVSIVVFALWRAL